MTCWGARKIRNGAVRWTPSIASHCSSVVFCRIASQPKPALFKMMSIPPTIVHGRGDEAGGEVRRHHVTDADGDFSTPSLDSSRDFMCDGLVQILDHHPGACGRGVLRNRAANAPACP